MRDVGDRIAIRHEVRDPDGTLTNATVAVTVTAPDGTTSTPTVSSTSTGIYDAAFTADAAGVWRWTWTVSGTLVDVAHGQVDVADPAPSTYASLALLKQAMGITTSDRDELLQQALASAARMVDAYTGLPVGGFALATSATSRTYGLTGRLTPDGLLLVDEIGSTTGLVIETGTASTSWTAVTDYETGPDNALTYGQPITTLARPLIGWPLADYERVRVTARWGWPYTPDQVVQATLIQATRLYRRKDSPEGLAGGGDFGPVRLSRVDPDVVGLLAPFALPVVA